MPLYCASHGELNLGEDPRGIGDCSASLWATKKKATLHKPGAPGIVEIRHLCHVPNNPI